MNLSSISSSNVVQRNIYGTRLTLHKDYNASRLLQIAFPTKPLTTQSTKEVLFDSILWLLFYRSYGWKALSSYERIYAIIEAFGLQKASFFFFFFVNYTLSIISILCYCCMGLSLALEHFVPLCFNEYILGMIEVLKRCPPSRSLGAPTNPPLVSF